MGGEIFAAIVLAALALAVGRALRGAPPTRPISVMTQRPEPERGDLGVLRLAFDASVRDALAEALERAPSAGGGRMRAVARVAREHRDAWRWAGAVDVEAGGLFDVPARFEQLLAEEHGRLAALDEAREPPDLGPFRSRGGLDDREIVLVVLVVGVRESPVLRLVERDTLVSVGEIGRGDSVAQAFDALATIADGDIIRCAVFVRPEPGVVLRACELVRAYDPDTLVALTP